MSVEELETILDEIRNSIPLDNEVDKLAKKSKLSEMFLPAFKLGVIASSMTMLKKYEEIYIKLLEDGRT